MKLRVIATLLLSLHLAFVILPEVQIWRYLYLIAGMEQTQALSFSNADSKPLTGDITYLSALKKRSGNESEAEEVPSDIPETTVSHTGLIYLPVESNINSLISKDLAGKYFHYTTNLIFWPKKIHTPPPRLTV